MPYALSCARAAQRDLVQQRHIVADHSCLADDNPCGVIHEDAPSYLGRGVNVHMQDLRQPALQEDCQLLQARQIVTLYSSLQTLQEH